MKLGLHAFSLLLAGGLREYQPVGRGVMTAAQLLDKAAQLKLSAVQLARKSIPAWDMVSLVNLRRQAEELHLALHLSTDLLHGEHLADMIRAAHTLGAGQVTVGLSHLHGNVAQRQQTLENLLRDLDGAIKTAERYQVVLAIENGRQTAAADLAALMQAAQSDWFSVCFDMGNALTVPESPVEAAETLAPYCSSAHLKDLQVYRTIDGAMLVNCPIGEGTLEVTDVLRVLKAQQPEITVFLQTGAERQNVPVLQDDFLRRYPRITARALAALLTRGELTYHADELSFPHERNAGEREVLKWEDERLKRSIKQAQKLMGTQSLTLLLD